MNFEDTQNAFIVAADMWSARHRGRQFSMDPTNDCLFPKLERSSDLVSLLWYHTIGGESSVYLIKVSMELTSSRTEPEDGSKEKVTCPKRFFIPAIAHGSTDTRTIMDIAFEACGLKRFEHFLGPEWDVPWPGQDLVLGVNSAMDNAFLALLGCKHGAGPARMLTQHKVWFGQKKISKITMWTAEELACPYNLVFEIGDVN